MHSSGLHYFGRWYNEEKSIWKWNPNMLFSNQDESPWKTPVVVYEADQKFILSSNEINAFLAGWRIHVTSKPEKSAQAISWSPLTKSSTSNHPTAGRDSLGTAQRHKVTVSASSLSRNIPEAKSLVPWPRSSFTFLREIAISSGSVRRKARRVTDNACRRSNLGQLERQLM